MSTPQSLPITMESKNDTRINKICQDHTHLIETLPKGNGWMVEHLYNYNGVWLNSYILKNFLLLNEYFKSQPSDIFLASFMKSGTTWLKALMFSTLNRDQYTFSNHHLLKNSPQSTFPYLDSECYPVTDFTNVRQPRLFHTHYPHRLLESFTVSCKIVYVCRDPKDVLISLWHFACKIRSKDLNPITLDEAFELFSQGVTDYGPFWDHVLSYWRASFGSPDMILFLKYEELKKQPVMELRKLAAFMGKPFTVDEEEKGVVQKIVDLCSFDNLSGLEVNKSGVDILGKLVEVEKKDFFRKGEIGDWKNYLDEKMAECIDRITEEKLRDSGLILGEFESIGTSRVD
uniref:flavonol 3-sulfotransferase-like n=1 Tax=Erigeron canadensis TaxID=72917 RepID=UPI001CB8B930|nr:flavonol 3-sulfotransferase-like [Erigeron canadensis]